MRNLVLLVVLIGLSNQMSAQKMATYLGFKYAIPSYLDLNAEIQPLGYEGFDDNAYQFVIGSMSTKKRTRGGFEFFASIPKKGETDSGNINKLTNWGILMTTRSGLNKNDKARVSFIFNFGYQRSDLLFYNEDRIKDLTTILTNKNVEVHSFKKNELVGEAGLGFDWISNGFGFGLDAGYHAGYGDWKYLNLVNPEFPKGEFGHFFATVKIYIAKKTGKLKLPLPEPSVPEGPMTLVD